MDPTKKSAKKLWADERRRALAASLPMPHQLLRLLLDHLDQTVAKGCDHTLRYTTAFLRDQGQDVDRGVSWLQSQGGYCDCEVLANVEDKLEEIERFFRSPSNERGA